MKKFNPNDPTLLINIIDTSNQPNILAMSNLTTLYDQVKRLLTEKEDYRNSDELLTARIWYDELKRINPNIQFVSAVDWMTLYKDGKVTTADSITRARRKVQEENIHLRGKAYNQRKGKKQEEVKQEIRNLNNREY